MKQQKQNIEYEIQKTEFEIETKWHEGSYIFKPQSQSTIWFWIWLGLLFGIGVIIWWLTI